MGSLTITLFWHQEQPTRAAALKTIWDLSQLYSHHCLVHAKVKSFHLPIFPASNTSTLKVWFIPGTTLKRWSLSPWSVVTRSKMASQLQYIVQLFWWVVFLNSFLVSSASSAASLIFYLLLVLDFHTLVSSFPIHLKDRRQHWSWSLVTSLVILISPAV